MLLQNATAILLQKATEVYYKMTQVFYYKMRQVYYKMQQLLQNAMILLQNASFIKNCDSTLSFELGKMLWKLPSSYLGQVQILLNRNKKILE